MISPRRIAGLALALFVAAALIPVFTARHVEEAVSALEQSVALYQEQRILKNSLGGARFALARALWEQGKDRTRARSLAEAARDDFQRDGKSSERDLADVQAWLARHR